MGFVSEEARDSSHIMSAAVRGGPETPQIWLTFVTCSLYHFCILLNFSRFPYSTWNKDNALSLYTYNDAAAMSIVSTKKTFKECISIPMAQVEGLLPLTPHPVPPSCWKVDKKGWDVFVISIVGCLWLSFGCLLVVFATYGLWVVYRRGGGCPPPLLLASVLGRGDRPNLNPTHLPPSTLNPQNHKSKSNEIGSDHPRYNKMIRS